MNPSQLADAVTEVMSHLRSRIEGIGASQYSSGEKQRIELLPFADLMQEAIEEIDDALVYLATMRFRLSEYVEALSKAKI